MAEETKQPNELTMKATEIDGGNVARERERAALYEELRAIEQQIAQILEHVRRAAEKVVEKVKGLVRCTQPDRDDTSAEPPKDERPKPTPQPQRGGDRGADDDWMPGRSLLD